jgi:hypothetical protein
MVAVPAGHDVTFRKPWYAAGRDVALHRYFDPDFIDRFNNDVLDASPDLLSWEQQDRDSTGLLLKLRRPIHRTFHLVAAEIACKLPGSPALGPEKIASAGFVVRSRQKEGIKGFRQVRGRPAGWQTIDETADPDASRQLQSYGVKLPQLSQRPGYTGEEVHPLHASFVQPQGDRPHTLLFGYLPIGGEEYTAPSATATNPNDLPEELPWPFGLLNHPDGAPPWTIDTEQQVAQGEAQSPLAALLRMSLNRYQLADPSAQQSTDNAAIFTILDRLAFHIDPPSPLSAPDLRTWASQNPFTDNAMPLTLGALVRDTDFASALSKALTSADPTSGVQLPADFVPANVSLLVSQTDAAALRSALQLRLAAAWTNAVGQFPVPKYPPGDTQFMVRPFVRTIRPDGCERITWGDYSAPFVLATVFDPDATRPVLIQMPELDDAQRGMARGAAFAMPPKLAGLVNSLTGRQSVQDTIDGNQPNGLQLGMICSFSIPIITICAMLILSIIINLLNILFFWLPFVKICLPVPKNFKAPSP